MMEEQHTWCWRTFPKTTTIRRWPARQRRRPWGPRRSCSQPRDAGFASRSLWSRFGCSHYETVRRPHSWATFSPAGATTSPVWRRRCAATTRPTSPIASTAAAGSKLHRIIDVSSSYWPRFQRPSSCMAFGVIRLFRAAPCLLAGSWRRWRGFALSALIWLASSGGNPGAHDRRRRRPAWVRATCMTGCPAEIRETARRLAYEDYRVMNAARVWVERLSRLRASQLCGP